MHLKKLDQSFYDENTHLVEVLDKDDFSGDWNKKKTRGYGFIFIQIDADLTFGIPLRSKITHDASYITKKKEYDSNNSRVKGKGLDFTKALLIKKESYISENPFNIPTDEHLRIQEKSHYISEKFKKYVEKYINAVKKNDRNIITSYIYKYTTLKNYHDELGI